MKKAGKILLSVLTAACLVYIFSNSLRTASGSLEQSGRFVTLVSDLIRAVTGKLVSPSVLTNVVRKIAHFSEFALLGALGTCTAASFFGAVFGRIHMILFWGLLSAVTDEFLQRFSRGRGPLVTDVVLDFCGFLTGFLIAWAVTALLFRIRRKYELGRTVLDVPVD